MYTPIPPQKTCAAAWLSAVTKVNGEPHHEAYNVIIDVADPLKETAGDAKIITLVDKFLSSHEATPLQAVANTIFPHATYRRHGAPKFYKVYLETIYPRVKGHEWGRYFERMINVEGGNINPLDELVKKLRHALSGDGRVFHNVYELAIYDPSLDIRIYDPARDAGRVMNRQCLSFLSFKLTHERALSLTAVYRNHFYIARLLGNMIGLGRLLEFMALETKASMGSLTIVSTHAEVDTSKWTRSEIRDLLQSCQVH